MTHRGPFQPLLFCDSVILRSPSLPDQPLQPGHLQRSGWQLPACSQKGCSDLCCWQPPALSCSVLQSLLVSFSSLHRGGQGFPCLTGSIPGSSLL